MERRGNIRLPEEPPGKIIVNNKFHPIHVMLGSFFDQTWDKAGGKEWSPTFIASNGCFLFLNNQSTYFTNERYIEIRGSFSGDVKHSLQCTDNKIRPVVIQLH